MTGPEGPDNLTSMESATETIKRIFGGSDSPLGSQIAQRDCFGAHTYERTDREGVFHHEWRWANDNQH